NAANLPGEKGKNHGARTASGAQNDRRRQAAVPARRRRVKVGKKSFNVGIGGAQSAVVEPQSVGRTDGARAVVRLGQPERGFLMRDRYIGADISIAAQVPDKF